MNSYRNLFLYPEYNNVHDSDLLALLSVGGSGFVFIKM